MAPKIFLSPKHSIPLSLALVSAALLFLSPLASAAPATEPVAEPWPPQFHSILFVNDTYGQLQVIDLWYDWPNRRQLHIIQHQLGRKFYDLEFGNGTYFNYTMDASPECQQLEDGPGILNPNWIRGANYLGQTHKDLFLCNVWEKLNTVRYYEDVATRLPVHLAYSSGATAHVMTFEVGEVLDEPNWQAPFYCFEQEGDNYSILESMTRSPTV